MLWSAPVRLEPPSFDYVSDGLRFLRTTDIDDQGRITTGDDGVYVDEAKAAGYELDDGDLLLSRSGTVGRSYLHHGANGPVSYAGYLVRFRPSPIVVPRFLFYFTKTTLFLGQVKSEGTQSTIVNVNARKYGNMTVPLPTLNEQAAIVDLLDRETARIDQHIAKKKRLIELLKEKHSSLIAQAVTGGLDDSVPMRDSGSRFHGDIPEHWELLPLRRLTSQMTNGYVGPTRDILTADGVPYVQSLHVKNGRIQHNADYFVSEEWHRAHDRTRLREGDLLLVQTGDIGQSAVVNRDSAGANCHALIILRFRSDIADPWYFGYAFRAPGGKAAIVSMKTGATHPHLNVGYVREVSFPVPPMGEQRRIVGFLDAETRVLTKAASLITSQLSLLGEYCQALITAAVTGQIDVAAEQPEPEGVTI